MNNIDPNKNCHEYCRVAKCCRYLKGENGMDPDECAMYYKIDDLLQEAEIIRKEQMKSAGVEEDDDW